MVGADETIRRAAREGDWLAAADELRASGDLDGAFKAAAKAIEALGGCQHCGGSGSYRLFDDYATCAHGPEGEDVARARALAKELAEEVHERDLAHDRNSEVHAGRWAMVVRGKKVPRGIQGLVVAAVDGRFGPRVLLALNDEVDERGRHVAGIWIAPSNLAVVDDDGVVWDRGRGGPRTSAYRARRGGRRWR